MKMKNMLIGGMSLALVACLSVGATLAYFTDSDKEVVNTFNFVTDAGGDGYINVTLGEKDPNDEFDQEDQTQYGSADATWNEENKGYEYTDVAPGQNLPKEPTVNVKTDVPAYIYLRVTDKVVNGEGNAQGMEAIITGTDTYWTKLGEATTDEKGNQVTVYYYNAPVTGTKDLEALFTEVKVPDVDPAEMSALNNVKIEVAAIQSAGFDSATDAYTTGNVANIFTSWNQQ